MPELDIQAARERCEAATPEPWEVSGGERIYQAGNPFAHLGTMSSRDAASNPLPAQANAEFAAHARSDLPAALEALEEAQMAGRKAQDKWEEWVESELAGTSQFRSAMREVKKNRAILGESE